MSQVTDNPTNVKSYKFRFSLGTPKPTPPAHPPASSSSSRPPPPTEADVASIALAKQLNRESQDDFEEAWLQGELADAASEGYITALLANEPRLAPQERPAPDNDTQLAIERGTRKRKAGGGGLNGESRADMDSSESTLLFLPALAPPEANRRIYHGIIPYTLCGVLTRSFPICM
ncbi:hypothetical protein RQP46_003561 [Phenoliferia psychrophenolica]